MGESQKHYATWKTPENKDYIPWVHFYKILEKVKSMTESKSMVVRSWVYVCGGWGRRSDRNGLYPDSHSGLPSCVYLPNFIKLPS